MTDPTEAPGPGQPGLRRAWFVVALLMGAYVLSFVDRQILSLMVKPIRAELGISDTGMSLLMGIAFSLFYSVCGIPIARWADRRSRRGLIVVGVGLWSLATASFGLAQRFAGLFLARIGVGVGEAALSPAAFSLITDYFPITRRATAISVYSTGISIGSGLALVIGGLLIHASHGITLPVFGALSPWRTVFLILGAAGLLYAPLLLLIREPPRRVVRPGKSGALHTVLRDNRRTLTLHYLGFAVFALASYGAGAWLPSFFIRVHHWTPLHVGVVYGPIITVFGTAGMIFGGLLADRLVKRGRTDGTLRVAAWAALAAIPFVIGVVLLPNANAAALCLGGGTFCFTMSTGVGPAALQDIVPSDARAQISAIFLFTVNLIGQGLGPLSVALVTDDLFGKDLDVGDSLLLVNLIALPLAALLLGAACAPYRASRQRLIESTAGSVADLPATSRN